MVKKPYLLRSKISENGYTLKRLANEMDMCCLSLSNKIHKQKFDFYLKESLELKRKLKLSDKEYFEIFGE